MDAGRRHDSLGTEPENFTFTATAVVKLHVHLQWFLMVPQAQRGNSASYWRYSHMARVMSQKRQQASARTHGSLREGKQVDLHLATPPSLLAACLKHKGETCPGQREARAWCSWCAHQEHQASQQISSPDEILKGRKRAVGASAPWAPGWHTIHLAPEASSKWLWARNPGF